MSKFKFIDLFAGIGAFHLALESLGGECVFAAEIDKYANETYKANFNMDAKCDVSKIDAKNIPKHDVLCAGFPCQPFSQGGFMKGFSDTRGTLFFEIERILKEHKTKFIILENVKHLVTHDNGNTYRVIIEHLTQLGYKLTEKPLILSPHQFGIPQQRERIFIVGIHESVLKDKKYVTIDLPTKINKKSIYDILDKNVDKKYYISEYETKVLDAWNDFHKIFKKTFSPIWFEEFGKTYDISDLQDWKQRYITNNRNFYLKNKEKVDEWAKKWNIYDFKLRDKKFEWQAGDEVDDVYDTIIQLRQSGVRCKKPNNFQTLVAMVQTPIVGKLRRRLTAREAARLQSFPDDYVLNTNEQKAFKQLGNSANVEIIKYIAQEMFKNVG